MHFKFELVCAMLWRGMSLKVIEKYDMSSVEISGGMRNLACTKCILCARQCAGALYMRLFSPYNNWSRHFTHVFPEEFETQRGEVAYLKLNIHISGESRPASVLFYICNRKLFIFSDKKSENLISLSPV